MRISSIGYIIKQGFKNIFTNKMFSLASIATMSACIFLFGIFYSILVNVEYSVKEAQSSVAVTVFFDEDIDDSRVQEIGTLIKNRPEVDHIEYISAEEAWEGFKADYLGEYAEGYEGDNPLEGSDNYEIYLNDVAKQTELVHYLETVPGIREINRSDITADILTNINLLITYVSMGIVAILLAVALFLISNTIIVGIAVRREEISIMKLVGAKNYIVRTPFIIEGLLIGLIGSMLPLIAIYFIYTEVIVYAVEKFSALSDILKFMSVNELFNRLVPVALALGIGVGVLGSMWAVRTRLKV